MKSTYLPRMKRTIMKQLVLQLQVNKYKTKKLERPDDSTVNANNRTRQSLIMQPSDLDRRDDQFR